MHINNEDYDLLCDIEIYLQKKNKKLFYKLWNMNEKLMQQKIEYNKKNSKRIANKRKADKNYAR